MLSLSFPKFFLSKKIAWDSVVIENGSLSPKQELRVGAKIGKGTFGTVYKGRYCIHHWDEPDDNIQVAVKKVRLPSHEEDVHRELRNLLELREERDVAHLYNYKEIGGEGLFVIELCEGGDLIDYALSRWLTEEQLKRVVRWLCLAVEKCHKHGIVHTDIKLDNIGLRCKNNLDDLCLLDFGNSKMIGKSYQSDELRGSPHYLAPELVSARDFMDSGEMFAIDVWCIGVCAYCLAEGCYPFENNYYKLKFSRSSPGARQFISSLLTEPRARATLHECLDHEWLSA